MNQLCWSSCFNNCFENFVDDFELFLMNELRGDVKSLETWKKKWAFAGF